MKRARLFLEVLVVVSLVSCSWFGIVRPATYAFFSEEMEAAGRFGRLLKEKRPFVPKEKENPKNAEEYYQLGVGLFRNGGIEEALKCFRYACKLEPKKAQYECALGQIIYFLAIFEMIEQERFKIWIIIPNHVSERSFQSGFLGFEVEAIMLIGKMTSLKKPRLGVIKTITYPYYKRLQQGVPGRRQTVPRVRFFPDEKAALLIRRALTHFRHAREFSGAKRSIFTSRFLDMENMESHLDFLLSPERWPVSFKRREYTKIELLP